MPSENACRRYGSGGQVRWSVPAAGVRRLARLRGRIDGVQRGAWLVRQPSPPSTLAWLVDELDVSGIVDVSVMQGGLTAAMHGVRVIDRDGHERQVVSVNVVGIDILLRDLAGSKGPTIRVCR